MGRKVEPKNTAIVREGLTHPWVNIECSEYGNLTAELQVEREKPRGGYEEIKLKFTLEPHHLECIGSGAVRALRRQRRIENIQAGKRLERITGYVESLS